MPAKLSFSEFFGGVTQWGDVTVIRDMPTLRTATTRRRRVWCLCACGHEFETDASSVKRGLTKSCGCKGVNPLIAYNTKHGMSKTPEYQSWIGMKRRCSDPENKDYAGRGISVCERWLHSFENFYADMGKKLKASDSLDRWPDNDGNYEPENCRWATKAGQANNRRNSPRYVLNGCNISLSEFAAEMGIKYHWVYHQAVTLKKGLPRLVREMQIKLTQYAGPQEK